MGFFSRLFGGRPSATCECGNEGDLYLENGAYRGTFLMIGKDEDARLIIECDSCHLRYSYDSITEKTKKLDDRHGKESINKLLELIKEDQLEGEKSGKYKSRETKKT